VQDNIAVFNNGSLGFVELEELVMPPKIEFAQVFGAALYSAKAVLAGCAGDVWELVTDNLG
jgi:pyruvate dehydrogenase (quinone)